MSKESVKKTIIFLRSEADRLNEIANNLENLNFTHRKNLHQVSYGEISSESLLNAVRFKSRRMPELCRMFKVFDDVITELIEKPESGIALVERGWIVIKQPFPE